MHDCGPGLVPKWPLYLEAQYCRDSHYFAWDVFVSLDFHLKIYPPLINHFFWKGTWLLFSKDADEIYWFCGFFYPLPSSPHPRTKLWEQLDIIGIGFMEQDYDKIMSNPQAIRYVINFMYRTGLLPVYHTRGGGRRRRRTDRPHGNGFKCGRRWVLANDDNWCWETRTQPKSTNMPANWPGQHHYQLKLRQGRMQRMWRESEK